MIEPEKAPSPNFFRVLISIGLALLALSGSFIASPVVLPTVVVSVTGYLAVAGAVLSAVNQMTVNVDTKAEEDLLNRIRKNNENLPRDAIK
jgi:ABC-type xylose transport system permease subunit